jgi:hypothetical protein
MPIAVRVLVILAAAASTTVAGQDISAIDAIGGPFTGPPVFNAPFSADATTTLTESSGTVTGSTRKGRARYYRDSAGRVRVQQTVEGVNGRVTIIAIDSEPGNQAAYTLHTRNKHLHPASRRMLANVFNGGSTFAIPLGTSVFGFYEYRSPRRNDTIEALGIRMIEGLETTGHRITTSVLYGRPENDGRLAIVDERWISPELKLVIHARTSDPVTGVLEYRLTNIRRGEPSPDLFVVPDDYTLDDCPKPDDVCYRAHFLPQANRQGGTGRIID